MGIYVLGDHAYVANRPHGLDLLDVRNPRNPVHLANLRTGGDTMGVYVNGRFAYLADAVLVSGDKPHSYLPKGEGALKVIDVKDPEHPRVVASDMSPGFSQSVVDAAELANVFRLDRIVYEADSQTAAISALRQMNVIRSGMHGFHIAGNYAYSTSYGGGLAIYDVTDPVRPRKVSVFATPYAPWDVRVAGRHAYIMDSCASIHVVDVSDPVKPAEIALFKCTRYVSRWVALQPPVVNATGTDPSKLPKLPAPKLTPIEKDPPRLVNERRLPDGSFEFTLVGVANGNYVIQYTADWSGWTNLSTNSLPANGYTVITDPHAPQGDQRFYRAVMQ